MPAEFDQAGFRQSLRRAVLPPLLLMGLLAGVLVGQVSRLLDVTGSVEQSNRVVAEAHDLEKLFVDLETGLRGYFLTGRADFLEPYRKAQQEVDREMADFRALVANSPT